MTDLTSWAFSFNQFSYSFWRRLGVSLDTLFSIISSLGFSPTRRTNTFDLIPEHRVTYGCFQKVVECEKSIPDIAISKYLLLYETINIASEIENAVNNFLTSFFILLEFFLPVRGSMYLALLSL